MKRLDGKVAIITGGAAGQGEAAARLFVAEGAKVVIADYDASNGKKVADELTAGGFPCVFVKTDVSSEEEVINMVNETLKHYGTVDVLLNNAGIGFSASDRYKMASIVETPLKDWNAILGINLTSQYLVSKYVLPIMIEKNKGSIVNISSEWGICGAAGADAYTATKGGIIALTRAMAVTYGGKGIRVNCIAPGAIETAMIADALKVPEICQLLSAVPLARIGQPAEVAYAALFLLSDEASFITGAILPVDGGYTTQ